MSSPKEDREMTVATETGQPDEQQKPKKTFRQRLNAEVQAAAIITAALAVCGLIIWLALVAGFEGTKKIKAWANAPPAVPFAKKQECSKYLGDPKLSTLLPSVIAEEITVGGHVWRNVVRDSPIVIYSSVLDTCIGLQTEAGTYDNRPYSKVVAVDLLTGETVGNSTFFGIENQRKWATYQGDFQRFYNDPQNRETIFEMKRTAAHQQP